MLITTSTEKGLHDRHMTVADSPASGHVPRPSQKTMTVADSPASGGTVDLPPHLPPYRGIPNSNRTDGFDFVPERPYWVTAESYLPAFKRSKSEAHFRDDFTKKEQLAYTKVASSAKFLFAPRAADAARRSCAR